MFSLKLKNDFFNVFLRETYNAKGLTDEEVFLAKDEGLEMDDNTEAMLNYFMTVQKDMYGMSALEGDDDASDHLDSEAHLIIEEEILNEVATDDTGLRDYLLNKTLVFTCQTQEIKETYI